MTNHLQNQKVQVLPAFLAFSLAIYLAQGVVSCCKKALSFVLPQTIPHYVKLDLHVRTKSTELVTSISYCSAYQLRIFFFFFIADFLNATELQVLYYSILF